MNHDTRVGVEQIENWAVWSLVRIHDTDTVNTVPEQKMTTKETWTFYLRRLFLFARLSYFFIAVLMLTKSSTLLSAPVFASTQQVSIVIIENVTDICFPKWALLERCVHGSGNLAVRCFTFFQDFCWGGGSSVGLCHWGGKLKIVNRYALSILWWNSV